MDEAKRHEQGTYLLTKEFFNVQALLTRVRGYAEVAPQAVNAAANAIYAKQLKVMNWLLNMEGTERYFGDKEAFRAAGKHSAAAKLIAETKVTDAAAFARSSAFVFAHSVMDVSITSLCEAAILVRTEDWIDYIGDQKVTVADIQSRPSHELITDRLAGLVHKLSRESIVYRLERLLTVLKPGKEYEGLRDYSLSIDTIKNYDRTRQDIIHERRFDIQLDRLEESIAYMESSFLYFAFLILWRYNATLNERAWAEALQRPLG